MKLFDIFRPNKRTSATIAKERLQIVVSHKNARHTGQDFIKKLQSELLDVISKYVNIDKDQIKVQLDRQGDQSVLELNVTLPEGVQANPAAVASKDKNNKEKNAPKKEAEPA